MSSNGIKLATGRVPLALVAPLVLVALFAGVISVQAFSDHVRPVADTAYAPLAPLVLRALNLGLDTATASFLWLQNVTELPWFPAGRERFFKNFSLMTDLDPRFSFPYAYTVIALPLAANYPERIDKAIEIGRAGIAHADPDWRIPFYLAAIYQLDKGDLAQAIKFYEITARTPGVPAGIQKFAGNFGISAGLRARTRVIWSAIAQAAGDEQTRARAKAYVLRLDLFDDLERAADAYRIQTGSYPNEMQDLVAAGMFPAVPKDPLGFPLYFNDFGKVTLNKPSYLLR